MADAKRKRSVAEEPEPDLTTMAVETESVSEETMLAPSQPPQPSRGFPLPQPPDNPPALPFRRTRGGSILDSFNKLAISGHRDFRKQLATQQQPEQEPEPGQAPSLPPSPPATPLETVLVPLKRHFNNMHSGGLLGGAVLAAVAAIQISAASVAVVMLAFAFGLGFLAVGTKFLSSLTVAKIWCAMMLVGPCCMLLAFSFVLSVEEIKKDIATEAQRRDAICVVMFLCGGLHASMPLSRRVKLIPASWFTLCAAMKHVVMYTRLHGEVAVSALALGLLNVVGPFWIAFCLMEAVGLAYGLALVSGLDASDEV